MGENPIDSVQGYIENANIRMQAGDLLNRCLDEGCEAPIQQLIEELVLAGPQNIQVLHEILSETEQRRTQVSDDIQQLSLGVEASLETYGIHLGDARSPRSTVRMSQSGFLKLLRQQQVNDEITQLACLQILKDARELMESLEFRLRLLKKIEAYIRDWLLGLTYQSVHQSERHSSTTPPARPH